MKLEAFKYYDAPAGNTGVAGIVTKTTPELLKLQAELNRRGGSVHGGNWAD
jgi:hypothetical protein